MVRAARHSSSSLLNERNLATAGFALQMRQRHLLRRLQTIRTSARRMIFGSIVPQLEMLSVLEPAASWEGTPATAVVAPSSLASRPVSVRFREPKLRSQPRDVMSTLLTRQTTESASTEIFVLGVKPNEVLLPNRRAMTACRKRALPANVGLSPRPRPRLGPASVTGKANAVCCTTMKANAGIVSFFICAASLFWRPADRPDRNLLLSVLHHPHIQFAPLLAGVIDRDARDDKGREQEQGDGVVGPTFHKGGAVLIHARRFAWSLGIFLEWKQQFRH